MAVALADDIHIRIEGKAGRITLTRPDALNAMTYDMCLAIEQIADQWAKDDGVELVVIDGEGDRAFCSGGDIEDLYKSGKAGDYAYGRKFWADEYRLNAKLAHYPKPYIAIMDGIVMGGGVGISAHGSHRITTENTLFAMPECAIGLVPDVGGNYILSRAPGRIGEYLGTTGARLKAADTIYSGFGDVFVQANRLPQLIETLCTTGDPASIDDFTSQPDDGYLAAKESEIDAYFTNGSAAEIAESLSKSGDEWLMKQAQLMQRGCPISVACALEIVRRSRDLATIEEVLALEYRFTYRSISHGDFVEGIRAQIIDKDRKPQWEILHLNEITTQDTEEMLSPLGDDELRV